MQADSASTSNSINAEPADKDYTIGEKEKLLKDIQKLKSIIEKCEWKLNTLRFKDVEEHLSELQSSETSSRPSKEIPNVQVDLQNELYNFAGFHCVKFRRDEVVFNFTSMNEHQKKVSYGVQIFIRNNKGYLGKWVMPMSINLNNMLTKIPIDKLENVTPFLKSCKHEIDCYIIRQEQFLSLKKYISNMKHCSLHSNMGYTYIILELYGVRDRENNRSINLIIYLSYHSNQARPHKISIDTMEEKLNNDQKQRLKRCLNEFKRSDLQTAFDKILTEDSAFTWIRRYEDDSESPLEFDDSSSCESLLDELRLVRKKSQRKRKKKRELQKEWNKKKRQKNVSKNIELPESNEEDNQTHTKSPRQISIREKETEPVASTSKQQEEVYRHSSQKRKRQKNISKNIESPESNEEDNQTHTKSPRQISIREKETEPVASTSKQQEVYGHSSQESIFTLHKSKVGLKQTKLNFQTNQTTNSTNPMDENLPSKLHNKPVKKKIVPLGTSTPYPNQRKSRKISSSSSLGIGNVTIIEAPKQIAEKFNDSKGTIISKKIVKKKTPKLSQGTTKKTGPLSHSPAVKRNQRHMRSTKKKTVKK